MSIYEKLNEIERDVNELFIKAENAKQISDDLCSFFQWDIEKDMDIKKAVLRDYKSKGIYSRILFDYMEVIKDMTGNLSNLIFELGQSEVQKLCQK